VIRSREARVVSFGFSRRSHPHCSCEMISLMMRVQVSAGMPACYHTF
jgi:hypothetical protein